MANLIETPLTFPAGIRQLETTDPVVGGPPNEGTGAGLSNIAIQQLAKRTAYLYAMLASRASIWTTYGGTANAITLAADFVPTAYVAGMEVRFRATSPNAGATTINLAGLGAKAARTPTGVALPAGFIRTDVDTIATYDGTVFVVSRAIESGEVVSGTSLRRWRRFEDGTLLQDRLDDEDAAAWTLAVNGGYARTSQLTWTFDVPFKAGTQPIVVGNAVVASLEPTWLNVYNSAATSVALMPGSVEIRASGTPKALTVHATGRWY